MTKLIPKIKIITTERVRKLSAGMCKSLTIEVKNNVKKVKLKINPLTIPKGRFRPPPTEADKTIGKIGKMHGDKIVTIPAKNANKVRITMLLLYTNSWIISSNIKQEVLNI